MYTIHNHKKYFVSQIIENILQRYINNSHRLTILLWVLWRKKSLMQMNTSWILSKYVFIVLNCFLLLLSTTFCAWSEVIGYFKDNAAKWLQKQKTIWTFEFIEIPDWLSWNFRKAYNCKNNPTNECCVSFL